MTATQYDEAQLRDLAGSAGARLAGTFRPEEASVAPTSVEEVRALSEEAARRSVPLIPLGAGTARARGDDGLCVRFDLMRGVLLPEGDECWVEAGPGASWLELDDELGGRGQGLAVYPTSAPRATVGGWMASDGLGVGSFEFGGLRENVLGARVVLPGGELRELPGEALGAPPEFGGGIVVGARLRTRHADADVPFAAAFRDPWDLMAAVEGVAVARPPLWHLAFLNPALARARHVGERYLLFGAYPRVREEWVARRLQAGIEEHRGLMLPAADAYRVWGERFHPVTPSAASVPEISRRVVPVTDGLGALRRMEGAGAAVQGAVSRSGEALLLAF